MQTLADRLLAGGAARLVPAYLHAGAGRPGGRGTVMRDIDAHTGRAYTLGITGPPGAGKSTIVDQLTRLLREQNQRVGHSSRRPYQPLQRRRAAGGPHQDAAALPRLRRVHPQRCYSRAGQVGCPASSRGIARALDAAGCDVVIVETVGVGQTELGIMGVADTVAVALIPEAGDSIQALKAGVMEIADLYVVNKADRDGADQMAASVTAMLQMSLTTPEWVPPVTLTAAHTGRGIEELWVKLQEHRAYLETSGNLSKRRGEHRTQEFLEVVEEELIRRLRRLVQTDPALLARLDRVASRDAEPYSAALDFLNDSALNPELLTTRFR